MQGNIEKTAKDVNNYKQDIIFYESAREGFSEVLKKVKEQIGEYTLFLPGYIGYSQNEGSGIYDPVIKNKINHVFYKMNPKLEVDINDFENKLNKASGKIMILVVHYFGYVDPNIEKIIQIAKSKNAIIIEDCAHALYTDYIDNNCGKYSDFSIYSLHKMLPYTSGGMVKINNHRIQLKKKEKYYNLLEYDLNGISNKRKENAKIIENELINVKGIEMLRLNEKYKNQTPQTYPILILNKDKNIIYQILNKRGYGVVSLYHTMIKPLQSSEFENMNFIAHKILNLPVHQDANKEQILEMCKEIKEILGEK